MATIKVACPECGQKVSGDEGFLGSLVECPICSSNILFPGQKPAGLSQETLTPAEPDPVNRIIRVGEPLPEKRKRKKLTVIAARLKNAAEDEEDLLLPPSPIFVADVRRRMELSQKVFARRLRIPLSTLRKWESNDTQPTGAAATLIEILDHRPELIHLLAE